MSQISIHLAEAACEPGDCVRCRVDWSADDVAPQPAVVVRLLWYTQGKGDEDVGVVAEQRWDGEAAGSHAFDFELPAFPWSFSGRLVSLVWAVEAVLQGSAAVDRATLVVAPGRQEIRL